MLEKGSDMLERLKEMPLPYQVTFFLTIIIAVITFSQVVLVSPLEAETVTVENQRKVVEKEVNTLKDFERLHPDNGVFLREVEQQVALVNDLIPNDPVMGNFLMMLEQTAKKTGVTIVSVTPGAIVNGQNYREMPVDVTVKGKFLTTLTFMDQCQNLQRFNIIRSVNVSAKSGVVECKIPFSVYIYGTGPQAPQKK